MNNIQEQYTGTMLKNTIGLTVKTERKHDCTLVNHNKLDDPLPFKIIIYTAVQYWCT